MVAQLHALSAQQNKHLLSVEFFRGNTGRNAIRFKEQSIVCRVADDKAQKGLQVLGPW